MDELLTVAEVAQQFRVDGTTVRRWIVGGALQAVELPRVGKRKSYRVKKSDVQNLINGYCPVDFAVA